MFSFKFFNKIQIASSLLDQEVLKESFNIYPKNLPKYFKNIPKKYNHFKSLRKGNTIKHCPGFINYFRNMISFKAPCDIEIYLEDNKIITNFGSGKLNDNKRFVVHAQEQFLSYVNQNKYAVICKLDFGINISADFPIIVNNSWWNFNNFEIVPGIINATDSYSSLNLFIPIPKNMNTIYIQKGQVMADLLFETDKKIKVDFPKKIKKIEYANYYFSVLKKMILPKRINVK